MKKYAIILLLIISSLFVSGAKYWMSSTGSFGNAGTYASPFNWTRGQLLLNAGDTLMFKNGIYTATAAGYWMTTLKDGTPENYITYKAETNGGVILDGNNFLAWDAFSVGNYQSGHASYTRFEGFEIRNFFYSGFEVQNSDHVEIRDCWIHNIGNICTEDNSGLNGISANRCGHMLVERCRINNIGRLGLNEGGCVPLTEYWTRHDHGMYFMQMTNLLVRNNVFYNNQKGYSVQFDSGGVGRCDGVEIINNTFYSGSMRSDVKSHLVFWMNMSNVLIANNIFHTQYSTAVYVESGGAFTYSNVFMTKNIIYGGTGLILSPTTYTGITQNNNSNVDPLMTNPAAYNFTIPANSPAVNAGYDTDVTTDYLNNPRATIDIGAYEYQSQQAPTVYWNTEQTGTAVKNDCETGFRGSAVTFTVAASLYSSTISQTAANNPAIAAVDAGKQAYANTNGSCTIAAPYRILIRRKR